MRSAVKRDNGEIGPDGMMLVKGSAKRRKIDGEVAQLAELEEEDRDIENERQTDQPDGSKPTRARGRGRGKGRSKGRGRTASSSTKEKQDEKQDEKENEASEEPKKAARSLRSSGSQEVNPWLLPPDPDQKKLFFPKAVPVDEAKKKEGTKKEEKPKEKEDPKQKEKAAPQDIRLKKNHIYNAGNNVESVRILLHLGPS